jgi:hypothetical protein
VTTAPDSFIAIGPTSEALLVTAEALIRYELPRDLRDFLFRTGGGEGWIGEGYVRIYSPQHLVQAHQGYRSHEFIPGLVLIGTDGGGEAFAIERDSGRYVMTPFVGDEPAVRIDAGGSFEELLAFVARGAISRPPTAEASGVIANGI